MSLDLRSLRQFVAVAEELHFGRAAERLHMTQPPLTQAIQKLETELGASLFVRSSRSVGLSPAGAALLPLAQGLLAQAAELPALAQAAARGTAGRLRLAFVSTLGFGELPRWLKGFREQVPDVALSLREATLDVQLQAFEAGEIDAGFVLHARGAVPPGFESLQVADEPLLLALSADSPLAGREQLPLAEVLGLPLVMFPRAIAPSLFDAVVAVYRAQGCEPRIEQEAIQMQTIVNLVSAGIGAAWVPASMQGFQRPGVVYRVLQAPAGEQVPLPRGETRLIWRHDAAPAVWRFVEHVAAQLAVTPPPQQQVSEATSSPR